MNTNSTYLKITKVVLPANNIYSVGILAPDKVEAHQIAMLRVVCGQVVVVGQWVISSDVTIQKWWCGYQVIQDIKDAVFQNLTTAPFDWHRRRFE